MKIFDRLLIPKKDGLPGYLAYPERKERGPALLFVHQNTAVTDYIKIEALKFAYDFQVSSVRFFVKLRTALSLSKGERRAFQQTARGSRDLETF